MRQSQITTTNLVTPTIHPLIHPIKAFTDNYIWAITSNSSKDSSDSSHLALVDPGDAQVCIDYIEQNQLILSSILITHHHADHIGGIEKLVQYCQEKQCLLFGNQAGAPV